MSLATRCPACATVFRVVQDQLRVSDGWVRCGRCGEVFNAGLALVNLDGSPRPVAPPPAAAVPPAAKQAPAPAAAAVPPPAQADTPLDFVDHQTDFEPTHPPASDDLNQVTRLLNKRGEPEFVISDYDPQSAARVADERDDELDRIDLESLGRRAALAQEEAAASAPAPAPAAAQTLAQARAQAMAAPLAPPVAPPLAPPLSPAPAPPEQRPAPGFPPQPTTEPPGDPPAAEADFMLSVPMPPSFVQSADRAARWQQPGVRRALWWLAGLGLVTLGLQLAAEYRAIAVARWPALRPLLTQVCELAGCDVHALRRIEALAVESSGLVRIEGTALYRLTVVLRNKAALELAAPALDLSLTDAQGKVIARRVLALAEVGVTAKTIAAGAELPIQAAVGVGDRQVVGYTVELFYP